MVQIFGNWGRIRTWINKRIRIKDNGNTFVGEDSGTVTTGNYNSFIGLEAGYSNVGGTNNSFFGYRAGYSNVGGIQNSYIGNQAGYSNVDGSGNSFFGYRAGYNNVDGENNVFIGRRAGYYETGENKLFLDNLARANEADGQVKALIYGVFAAATANQRLSINGRLLVREVPTYANDAAAGTGGLVAGEIYKHADGSLHIKL